MTNSEGFASPSAPLPHCNSSVTRFGLRKILAAQKHLLCSTKKLAFKNLGSDSGYPPHPHPRIWDMHSCKIPHTSLEVRYGPPGATSKGMKMGYVSPTTTSATTAPTVAAGATTVEAAAITSSNCSRSHSQTCVSQVPPQTSGVAESWTLDTSLQRLK